MVFGVESNLSAPPGIAIDIGLPVQGFGLSGGEDPGSPVIPDPAPASGPSKMLSIVDESGEVLSGMVSRSVHSAILRNIARQKKDYSKKREEWLQRVIKAHLVLAICLSLLSPAFASGESSNQENTDWEKYFRDFAASFNQQVSSARNVALQSMFTKGISLGWYLLTSIPGFVAWTLKFAFYDVPVTCWEKGDYLAAFLNLFLVSLIVYVAYYVFCLVILAVCAAWRANRMLVKNATTLMRELPWILYNCVVFWRKPFVVLGGEDHISAKYVMEDGRKVIKVYLRGREIQTIVDNSPIVAKEMAFPGTKAHKVQSLANDMLRTQVLFYYKTTSEFVFVGQGTVVAIKSLDGVTRIYVVTAAHVADAATHYSAACTHGSAGQRFQEIGKFVVKTAYKTPDDLDFCAFEVSQSQLSKASLPTHPSLKAASPCNTRDCYVTEDDVLECIGLGDPHSLIDGFFHSSGKVLDSPASHDFILGHMASTKHGWSGCGMFRRHGTTLNLAGIHTGRCGDVNSMVLFEEMEEYLSRDIWLNAMSKESPTRKNRKGGGRKGADANQVRSDRARLAAATGEFSGYDAVGSGQKQSALNAPAQERAMTDDEKAKASKAKSAAIKALRGVAKQEQDLAEAKSILAKALAKKQADDAAAAANAASNTATPPFRAPVIKPQTGATAVAGSLKGKVTFSKQEPTTSSFQFPRSGMEGSKLSALALGRLIKPKQAKATNESEPSSENSSQTSRTSSTTPTSPKTPSSAASSNITPTNMEESGFTTAIGKQRKKLIQGLTKTLASAGASACVMDLMKQGSNQSLRELGKLLSTASTASPPQGTPTDSTSKPTEASSTKSKATLKKKFSPGSAKSTLATETSSTTKKTAKSGSTKV